MAYGHPLQNENPYWYHMVNFYINIKKKKNILLMGKFTISMVIFHSYVTNYQVGYICRNPMD